MNKTIPYRILLVALLCLVAVFNARSYDLYQDGIYYNLSGNEATVTYGTGDGSYAGDVVIPKIFVYRSSIYTVVAIGDNAFENCPDLTHVTLPASVTSIGDYAFYNCPNLEGTDEGDVFYLPENLDDIGLFAFAGGNNITSFGLMPNCTNFAVVGGALYNSDGTVLLVYPGNSSMTTPTAKYFSSTLTVIGPGAFAGCPSLVSVELPETLTTIGIFAFDNCPSLTRVVIPHTVTSLGTCAFRYCVSLTEIICMVPTPFLINAEMFELVENATLIVPSSAVSTYGTSSYWQDLDTIKAANFDFVYDGIYYKVQSASNKTAKVVRKVNETNFDCYDYVGYVEIPKEAEHDGENYEVKSIDYYAFYYNKHLTGVSIPSTVEVINERAFYYCNSLADLSIGNNVTTIGVGAFYYCSVLPSLSLPQSLTTIGNYAFGYCTGLTSVVVPNAVTTINNTAFSNCSSLESVILGSGLTSIGIRAFDACPDLLTIHSLAETPPTIDQTTFMSSHYSNATLYVPEGSTSAYQNAEYWSNFTSLQSPETQFVENGIYYYINSGNTATVTHSGTGSYNSYSGDVVIPMTVNHNGLNYTVTEIGERAFYSCSSLTSVSIPGTVTSIGNQAFTNCSQLTSLEMPNSVTELGEFLAMDCSSLTAVTLSDNLTEIPRQAFTYCTSLTNVTLPDGLKILGAYSFAYTGLTSIELPEGLEKLDYGALRSTNLVTISIPASVSVIEEYVFNEALSLTEINVDSNNSYYCSESGVLFNKQRTLLVAYPANKADTEYVVPSTVTEMADNSASFTQNLVALSLPVGLKVLGFQCLAFAEALESIIIPYTVDSISTNPFAGCEALESIEVAESSTSFVVHSGALYSADKTRLIAYPAARPARQVNILPTVTTMDYRVFMNSSALHSVYIPGSLKEVSYQAFQGSSVENVVIDEGVERIEMYGFNYSDVKSLYLPSTLEEIATCGFTGCPLTQVTYAAMQPVPASINNLTHLSSATLYVPQGASANYASANRWSEFNIVETESLASATTFVVDSLNYKVLDDVLNVSVTGPTATSIYDPGIPAKVVYQGNLCTVYTIGDNAFKSCSRLAAVDVPHTVWNIGGYAFYNCSNLKTVTLNEGLQRISQFALSTTPVKTLTIPASVDSIDGSAFCYNTSQLRFFVEWGNSKYCAVGGVLFSKDKQTLIAYPNAKSVYAVVPEGTKVLGANSFRGTTLTAVTLLVGLTTIGAYAFCENKKIEEMVVPEGVTLVDNNAFTRCTALERVEFPSTLTDLKHGVFSGATALAELVVKAVTPPTCEVYQYISGTVSEPFMDAHYSSVVLKVPTGSKAAYQEANVWTKFVNIAEVDFPIEGERGDVNGDGNVDITDVTVLIDYLLGSVEAVSNGSDCNLDGNIDITDVTVLIDYLLGSGWPVEPKSIELWCLYGTGIGSEDWGSGGFGVDFQPLYPLQGTSYDVEGHGILEWVGYLTTDCYFCLLTPDWGEIIRDENDNTFFVETDGYYTVRLNTATREVTITPYSATPTVYDSMCLVGDFNSWLTDGTPMTPVNKRSPYNHDWYVTFYFETDGSMKFVHGQWDTYWGTDAFPYGMAITGPDGQNIPVPAGSYKVVFNDITGNYIIVPEEYPWNGLVW